jgi:metabolite-proton symporter
MPHSPAASPNDPDENRTARGSLARVVAASLIGTTVEWYDFFLYGSAAALVFGKLFFPGADPLSGTLLAFATYALGFGARPLGGLVFGHFGDRYGRKKLLVLSLLLMGGSTFAMGLLPSYATLGVGAPLLLTALRLIQGFALGGEWGGAVLIVSEHGDSARRGFWASWPQAGAPGGNLLATAVLAVLAAVQSDATFLAWGWRIPFLLSGVLVGLGLWIRLRVTESPVFLAAQRRVARAAARDGVRERAPMLTVLREQWRAVLVAMGARMGENISYYVITSFILVYVVDSLKLPKSVGLDAVLIGSAVEFVAIPLWGALSDRIGRRPVYLAGAIGMAGWIFAFFALLGTRSTGAIVLATTVALVLHGAMYGPQAAFFAELFGTRVRYSGSSIGYQLASILAGGLAPLIATALLAGFGSATPISVYVLAGAALTVLAVLAGRETRGRELADDQAEPVAAGRSAQSPARATP